MRSVLHGMRLLLWLAAIASVMAMFTVWGPDTNMASGPPKQLERHVNGVILLLVIAAFVLSFSGRGKQPPAWWARAVTAVAGVAAVAVTFALRAKVRSEGTGHLIEGAGWAWMLGAAAAAALAGVGSLALPRPKPAPAPAKKRR